VCALQQLYPSVTRHTNKRRYSSKLSFNYKIYASSKIKFSVPHPPSLSLSFSLCIFMKKSLISFFRYFQMFVALECVLKSAPWSSSFFLITKRGKKRKGKEVQGEVLGEWGGGGGGVLLVLTGHELEKKLAP
jgi:hypothetical protein